jgi:Ribbon-helix-helix protein, copG family
MTVVQARLPELEYELLRKRARAERRPIQDVVREALRAHVLIDSVDPSEPIFRELAPRASRRGRDRTSERVDELLYPSSR